MLDIARPLHEAEWDIVQGYARRVRHLRILDPLQPVDLSAILSLCYPPVTYPLFPNLRSIVWNNNRSKALVFLGPLCSPLLTSLTFDIPNTALWGPSEIAALIAAPQSCPALKVVTLPSTPLYPPSPVYSKMLLAWCHLEEVTCGEIDTSAFSHLAHQTTLRKLSFKLTPTVSKSLYDGHLSMHTFSRIRELDVHAADLPSLVDLMQKFEMRPTVVHGRLDTSPTPWDISAFFTFLTERHVGVKLRHISLEFKRMPSETHPVIHPPLPPTNDSHDDPSFHTSIYGNIIMPLAQFGSIDTLIIDIKCSIHLTDEDLSSLASAWPHLRALSLNKTHGWVKSGITQVGLLKIVECCPKLQTLCIAINTDTFREVPLERPGRGIQNRNIQTLAFADSVITSCATTVVAAFLSDVFPNLHDVTAWKSDQMRKRQGANIYATHWDNVSQQVKGMIRIRQQERRWRWWSEQARYDLCSTF